MMLLIITPHDCFHSCLNFEVNLMSHLLSEHNLFVYIDSTSKLPDHSVLCVHVILDKCNGIAFTKKITRQKEGPFHYVQSKKYDFENVPNSFMQNENWLKDVSEVIDKIEENRKPQTKLDCVYSKLCQCILNEMDTHLKYNSQSKVTCKKFKR